MKKIIVTVFSLVLIFNSTYSQKKISEEKLKLRAEKKEVFLINKNSLSFSPFNIIFSQFQFSYERRFGTNNSLMIIGSILHNRDAVNNKVGNYNFSLATELYYRKYVFNALLSKKKNPKSQNTIGFYVAPFVGYQYLQLEQRNTISYIDERGNYTREEIWNQPIQNAIQAGLVTGLNLNLLKGRLHLDFYTGFAEKLSFVNGGNPQFNDRLQNRPGVLQFDVFGIIPKVNMQIGFNF